MVWPWIERFDFLKAHRNFEFNSSFKNKIEKYMEHIKSIPAVKKLHISPDKHEKFYEAYIKKDVINAEEFDHGLP